MKTCDFAAVLGFSAPPVRKESFRFHKSTSRPSLLRGSASEKGGMKRANSSLKKENERKRGAGGREGGKGEMMHWELSLMWEQHGRAPDTWGHFHFVCQLRQTATTSAEQNISRSFSWAHFTFSTLPSQPDHRLPLFFQVPKQYVILFKTWMYQWA